jgi:hypothetical protein
MNLHEIIEFILKEEKRSMTPRELADYINIHNLYSRSDGKQVPESQIIERINKYSRLFEKRENGLICRINYLQKDIVNIALNMQNYLRNTFAHSLVFNIQDVSLVPFIFFYKRSNINYITNKKNK